MVSTRTALRDISAHVDESMGVRQVEFTPQFSPVVSGKDIGRAPLRKFGRLKLSQIVPDAGQPRSDCDEKEIQHLASSLRDTGQLHPVRVRWNESRGKWVILTGERRYRAALAAGLDEIDCFFHEGEITEAEILEQQLVENLHREDLKPLDEARGYAALMSLHAWNGRQVADALHVSRSKVSRALALLDLPADVQARIESGEIARSSAYELSKLDSEGTQRSLAREAANGGLTQRRTAKAVRKRKGQARGTRSLSRSFVAENGIRVTVTGSRNASYYEVEQALQEALDEVRVRIENNIQWS